MVGIPGIIPTHPLTAVPGAVYGRVPSGREHVTAPTQRTEFTRFLGAHGLANLGDGILLLAVPWLVSLATRDPLTLAAADAVLTLPWLVASVPAGVLIDRVASRGALVVRVSTAQAVAMAALAGLVWAWELGRIDDTPFLVSLLGAVALVGCAEVIRDLANHTLVPVLAPTDLTRANGRMGAVEAAANQFAGGPVGGLALAIAAVAPFALNAGLFTVATVLLVSIPRLRSTHHAAEPETAGVWRRVGAGFVTFNRSRLVRAFTAVICLSNGLDAVVFATFVFYAQEVLGVGAATLGALYALGALGAIIGGVAVDRLIGLLGEGPAVLAGMVAKCGFFAVVVWAPSPAVIGVTMLLNGLALGPINALSRAVRQAVIPASLLGRVTSVHRLLAWGVLPVGSMVGGVLVAAALTWVDRGSALRVPAAVALVAAMGVAVGVARSLPTARIRAALDTDTPIDP